MDASTAPFPETLDALLTDREMSRRELVRRCRERGWGNVATIHYLMRSEEHPTARAMETIAAALGISPSHFAEYRLARARTALDERVVGFEAALSTLESLGI